MRLSPAPSSVGKRQRLRYRDSCEEIPSPGAEILGSTATNANPSPPSSLLCVGDSPGAAALRWISPSHSTNLQRPLLRSLTRVNVPLSCQKHAVRWGCCRWDVMSLIPSISEVALAEISKTNSIKHDDNCIFAGNGKNNQMKKDKTSRERKFISKHLRECYKQ